MVRCNASWLAALLCVCHFIENNVGQDVVPEGIRQQTGDDLQTLVEKFMKKVKDILDGNDPYNYAGADGNSNSYGILFNASVSNLIISRMSTMNVTGLSVIENDPKINLQMNLTFDDLLLAGNYGLNLEILTLLKLYGSGDMGIKLSSMSLDITALMNQEVTANNILQFEDLSMDIGVKKVEIDVKNFLNRQGLSTYASQILTDLLPLVLNEDEKLEAVLNSLAKSKLNSILMEEGITLAIVIDFMKHLVN